MSALDWSSMLRPRPLRILAVSPPACSSWGRTLIPGFPWRMSFTTCTIYWLILSMVRQGRGPFSRSFSRSRLTSAGHWSRVQNLRSSSIFARSESSSSMTSRRFLRHREMIFSSGELLCSSFSMLFLQPLQVRDLRFVEIPIVDGDLGDDKPRGETPGLFAPAKVNRVVPDVGLSDGDILVVEFFKHGSPAAIRIK